MTEEEEKCGGFYGTIFGATLLIVSTVVLILIDMIAWKGF